MFAKYLNFAVVNYSLEIGFEGQIEFFLGHKTRIKKAANQPQDYAMLRA
ncbi:MAG TPA: hypothetical protein ACFCUY_18210 [Xenococcaceae cyanobacterium]|jgi:hypothetical protein